MYKFDHDDPFTTTSTLETLNFKSCLGCFFEKAIMSQGFCDLELGVLYMAVKIPPRLPSTVFSGDGGWR